MWLRWAWVAVRGVGEDCGRGGWHGKRSSVLLGVVGYRHFTVLEYEQPVPTHLTLHHTLAHTRRVKSVKILFDINELFA